MTAKSMELIQARELMDQVLSRLEVEAYLFEIEPREGKWQLKVECAVDGGWAAFTLEVAEPLPGGKHEEAVLLEQCRSALAACKCVPKG